MKSISKEYETCTFVFISIFIQLFNFLSALYMYLLDRSLRNKFITSVFTVITLQLDRKLFQGATISQISKFARYNGHKKKGAHIFKFRD